MITKITMKNVASYNEEGVSFDRCKLVNVVYGTNGAGKTTVSNYMRNLDQEKYKDCSIEYDKQGESKILVYNRYFKKQNLSLTDIPGTVAIGEVNIENQNKMKQFQMEECGILSSLEKRLVEKSQLSDAKIKLSKQYIDPLWDEIKDKKNELIREAFRGSLNSRIRLMEEMLEWSKRENKEIKTKEEIDRIVHMAYDPALIKINELTLQDWNNQRLYEIEEDSIMQKVIIGKQDIDIDQLIHVLGNQGWVSQGRKYIQPGSMKCPFCQQETITTDFTEKLENYFSTEYQNSIKILESNQKDYLSYSQQILDQLKILEGTMENITQINIDLQSFKLVVSELENLYLENKHRLEYKGNEPSAKINLQSSRKITKDLLTFIEEINQQINQFNEELEKYSKNKILVGIMVKDYYADLYQSAIKNYRAEKNKIIKKQVQIEQEMEALNNNLKKIREEITKLEYEMNNFRINLDSINHTLKLFGIHNFKLAESPNQKNCFQIQRENGLLANNTLSEGEETLITFLYFMQIIEEDQQKKIAVIDDPISSLDSNTLFLVSNRIKTLIRSMKSHASSVEQLFIFTHNIYFHKEVTNRIKSDLTSFYLLHKKDNISHVEYCQKNPISSSFALLWDQYREGRYQDPTTVLNIMRRIIENYFSIWGGQKYDHVKEKFDQPEEKELISTLYDFQNDGSHCITDDLTVQKLEEEQLNIYKRIFKEIFIRTGNQGFYEMMMKESS